MQDYEKNSGPSCSLGVSIYSKSLSHISIFLRACHFAAAITTLLLQSISFKLPTLLLFLVHPARQDDEISLLALPVTSVSRISSSLMLAICDKDGTLSPLQVTLRS